jgi:protein O-GlcNAc transferase
MGATGQVERWYREAADRFRRGDAGGAERLCHQVLAKEPRHAGALVMAGWLAAGSERHEAAVLHLALARELVPDDAYTAFLLGRSLYLVHRFDAATEHLNASLRLNPSNAEAHRALGMTAWEMWDYAGARDRFEAAHRLEPHHRDDVQNLLFAACYDPDLSPAQVRALHDLWGPRYLAGPPAGPVPPHANRPDPDRPLRVGYLSPDFWRTPVSVFLSSIVAYHHPAAVATYCYADVAWPDAVTGAFRQVCPNWRDVHGVDDAGVADRIRADGIDILVEMAGYTGASRLSVVAYRPAPLQVSYLGYPATTGLPMVDWRLTDVVANPPGTDRYYTERLARVEGGFCCYLPPPDAPDPGPPPAARNGYVTFGSFVNTKKVNRHVIALWARVLAALPGSRLFLFRHTLSAPPTRERFLAEFERHGIARDRVRIGWERPPGDPNYLGLYREVDAVLDTLPFNGHTSTCEALWMGVPVVTRAGADFAGRLSASVLAMAGLAALVADTDDAFVATAARAASDVPGLARLRQGLRDHLRRTRLLDAEACTRALEAAYRGMWRDWCARRGTPAS